MQMMMIGILIGIYASMKAPPKRKGNTDPLPRRQPINRASMKAPPKRKGNICCARISVGATSLNESPSEKEGKFPAGKEFSAEVPEEPQ